MLLSRYFLPTLKENRSDAGVISHNYLLRGGFIRPLASGIYNWLPAGLRVLNNIRRVIDLEMTQSGALEVLMSLIQPASLWLESGRYDDYGAEMLRIKDRHDRDMLFGPTHEEAMTDIFRNNVKSYKDLPLHFYHIQWKFRDEVRPRFGLMRGREFLMKDGYSFDKNYEDARATYKTVFLAYLRIFRRLGLMAVPLRADNGAIGGDLSHEFHILADTGESGLFFEDAFMERLKCIDDKLFDDIDNYYAATDDVHCKDNSDTDIKEKRGIEVGHIFYFGTKYTESMNAAVQGADGKFFFPHMGSYGIGVSRLLPAIVEAFHDRDGIIWPEIIAPFKVAVLNLKQHDSQCCRIAESIYQKLINANIDAIYDDTDDSSGIKISRTRLIGIPKQIMVGNRAVNEGKIECKKRSNDEIIECSLDNVIEALQRLT